MHWFSFFLTVFQGHSFQNIVLLATELSDWFVIYYPVLQDLREADELSYDYRISRDPKLVLKMSTFILSKLFLYIPSLLLCGSINKTHRSSASPLLGRFFPFSVNPGARLPARGGRARVTDGSARSSASRFICRGMAWAWGLRAEAQTSYLNIAQLPLWRIRRA